MDLVDRLSPRGFDCVCGNFRMAARAVSSVYDRHLAAAGVQSSQMAVLWAVSNGQGMTVKQLAARVAMHETTLIRNLRILEREGWVALKVGSDDRRQRIPSLTRAGRSVFGKALLGWKKAQAEVARVLDDTVPETNRKLVRLTRAIWNDWATRGSRRRETQAPCRSPHCRRSPTRARARCRQTPRGQARTLSSLPGDTMKNFSLAAIGAAVIMTGCVAYPVDTYHDRGDRNAYRDQDRRYDRDDRRDEWRERDRDRKDNDRDGDRRDWPARP